MTTLREAVRAVDIIRQASEGVGYAHRQVPSVLHRDIKPGNIYVLDDGRVKVIDFGLARSLGEKSMTAAGQVVGTPVYMAPEVLDGKKPTPRSDVYGLGIVLYRLLAGRLPFDTPEDDSSIQAVFHAVIRGLDRGLPDIREFVPGTSTELSSLLMGILSKDPGGRPVDGQHLAGLLAKMDTAKVVASESAPKDADETRIGIVLESARGNIPKPLNSSTGLSGSADRSLLGLEIKLGNINSNKPVLNAPQI